jgi:hypothetical protein
MGDDSTSLDSHQEAGDDGAGDDGYIADGGAKLFVVVIVDVVGEEAANVERESAVDQQVQHLNHFLFISVISLFLSLPFFIMILPRLIASNAGDTQTELPEGAMADAMGEEELNVEKESSEDEQVQHLIHFCASQSFICFFISAIFYNVSPSGFWKHCW